MNQHFSVTQLRQTGVVAGFSDSGFIIIKKPEQDYLSTAANYNNICIQRKNYLWFADLMRASVLSKSIVTYPAPFGPVVTVSSLFVFKVGDVCLVAGVADVSRSSTM